MPNWSAQSIQLVWFNGPTSQSAAEVFSKLFSAEPDASQSINAPALPRQSQASSVTDGIDRRVIVQPGRIDLIATPIEAAPQISLRSIADVKKETQRLMQAAAGATALHKATRLALVTNLIYEHASPQAATTHINELLGNMVTVPNPSDLMFQVNSPKPATRGLKSINRLLRWNVLSVQAVEMQTLPTQGTISLPVAQTTHYSALMVDLNTIPTDPRPFTAASYPKMWDALSAEAARLREFGRLEDLGQ